ncbi:efflux RND transporter periplasmic adaptor subunit [Aliidiomarina taiwanensis]|uniref:Efflux RND transporter periplasmic adaptor subunit n=1 Tax=Aliidiomarina taiwanensis TaxID=946228 RepID=A0A432X9I0_9GAMM|nr:efflux RND transporter periplasmic adaptor subunit [Aliidiomarina taiwanensis]RUO43970.1 efflux RND transporter periplasmic adaptor subunit [Aliidiomarina taiwanensis]
MKQPTSTHFIVTSAIAAMLIILTGCGNMDPNRAETAQAENDEPGVPVETLLVEQGNIRASFNASAILEAEESTDVVPRVNGIIEEIFVEEGDFVSKGQVLAKLESSRYALAVSQIEAELRNVRQELERNQQLAASQLVSADAVSRLQSQLDSLTARLELAKIDLDETTVRAPISGHISRRYARTGRLIQAWQPESMFHIVDSSLLRATVHLPEHALTYIRPGLPADLQLQALPGEQITATVTRVSPVIDSGSGTFRTVLSIENDDFKLRAGMFARIQVHYAERSQVVRIPQDALIRIDNQSHVFVVSENEAKRVEVVTGLQDGNWFEVVAGLERGDELIITGQNNLRDGAKVEAITQ